MDKGKCEHSTINIKHDCGFMKRYVSIIIQLWVTPTCAKCDDMWEEPGLGRAGQDHHRGRDHAPMCWPTPGCRGHRAAELNTAILSRYLCISHHSPRQWRSRLKQSIVDILPWGLCTACCVDTGQQRSGISACHKSVHFNALLGYIPFHILILWFWFSNCIHIRKSIKNINHRNGQDSSSAAGL